MNLDEIKRKYIESEPLELPYKTKFGFTLGKVSGSCCACNKKLDHLKGSVIEYDQCIEIRSIGICEDCKLVVQCHPVRYYSDGRFLMRDDELGWTELHSGNGINITKGVAIAVVLLITIVVLVTCL